MDAGCGAARDSGYDAGINAGSNTGINAGSNTGISAGSEAGNNADDDTGINVGSEAGNNADDDTGINVGSEAGNNADNDTGNAAGNDSGLNPGSAAGNAAGHDSRSDAGNDGCKVAILTGAAAGIGAATALALAGRGYNLVLNYFSSEAAAAATRTRCQQAGAKVELCQGDVADDAVCRALAARALRRWGRIDLLVNNAGRTVFSGLENWDLLTAEQFDSVLAVNARAAFQMVRACLPELQASGGSIVNVSSAAGVLGRGSSVPYLMSKGALNSLTLYLARVLAPRVRVNAVCPGLVTTGWFRKGLGQAGCQRVKDNYEGLVPLARANAPEDVAAAILWLATAARTMTGELLMLDGGLHLGPGS